MSILLTSTQKITNTTTSINSTSSIDITINKQKQITIKCSNNNPSTFICTNEKCKSNSIFTCGLSKCKCQLEHKLCLKANLDSVVQIIEEKIYKTDGIKMYIENKIQNIISKINQLKQKLVKQVDSDFKYTRLYQVQKQLLYIIYKNPQKKNQRSFKSTDSALLWKIINSKQKQVSKIFQDTKKLLNKLQSESQQSIDQVNCTLAQLLQNQKNRKNGILPKFHKAIKQEFSVSQKTIIDTIIDQSSICKTSEHSQRLIKFFQKKLSKMELLFKASQHGFKLAKFYEMCGTETKLIILCQSDKGKIVGGYTPFSFYQPNLAYDQWVQDPLGQSFMFSLSNNDKFFLNQKLYSIYQRKNKDYIQFGSSQIVIYDDANNAWSQNYLRCNYYYMNQNYRASDKESYISFNGNEGPTCGINEYEVWKVQYE